MAKAKKQKAEIPVEFTDSLIQAAMRVADAERAGRSTAIGELGGTLYRRPDGVRVSDVIKAAQNRANDTGQKLPGLSAGNCSKYETLYREYAINGDCDLDQLGRVAMRPLYDAYTAFISTGKMTPKEVLNGLIAGTLEIPKAPKKDTGETLLKVKKETAERVKEYGSDADAVLTYLMDSPKGDGIDGDTREALNLLYGVSGAAGSAEFLKWARKIAAREEMKKKVPA